MLARLLAFYFYISSTFKTIEILRPIAVLKLQQSFCIFLPSGTIMWAFFLIQEYNGSFVHLTIHSTCPNFFEVLRQTYSISFIRLSMSFVLLWSFIEWHYYFPSNLIRIRWLLLSILHSHSGIYEWVYEFSWLRNFWNFFFLQNFRALLVLNQSRKFGKIFWKFPQRDNSEMILA